MDIEKLLLKERNDTQTLIKTLEKRVFENRKKVGNKKLCCSSSNKVPQYKIDGKYISKRDLSEAKMIAQLKYDSDLLEKAKDKLENIEGVLAFYADDKLDYLYNKMCEGRKRLVIPHDKQKEIFVQEWINKKYEPYDRWDDVKTEFYTKKGERVRSKSEMIIANELDSYNVPYRYEAPLEFTDGNKKIVFHPDFVALNRRTLNEYVIEHLGMMDKFGYYNSNLHKIDVIEKNGYLLGVNYLLFHETSESAINVQVVRKYIEEYLI